MNTRNPSRNTTIKLTAAAMLMSMNIVLSAFGIPVPGGHLYLCDVIICLAAIILNPGEAFIVGGVGSFIGDLIFYPAAMFVSLITHGLQAVVISLISHHTFKHNPRLASGIGVAVGAVIMVIGYTIGRTFVYSTWEYAVIKLPFEIFQASFGAVMGMLLCWRFGMRERYLNLIGR